MIPRKWPKPTEPLRISQGKFWQSFNISKTRELSALKKNYKEIVKYQKEFWTGKRKWKNTGREKKNVMEDEDVT